MLFGNQSILTMDKLGFIFPPRIINAEKVPAEKLVVVIIKHRQKKKEIERARNKATGKRN